MVFPLLAAAGVLAAVLAATAVLGDLRRADLTLGDLDWRWIVWTVPLAAADHGIRFLRWEMLLSTVSKTQPGLAGSGLPYLAGSLFIFTPARAGEVAKSLYARDRQGIPVPTSLPILAAERITDLGVMAGLGCIGLVLLGEPANLVEAGAVLAFTAVLLTVAGPLLDKLGGRGFGWLRLGKRLGQMLQMADESRRDLMAPRTLARSGGLGAAAWLAEVLVYFCALAAAGLSPGWGLFVVALAVFPLASMAGSLSLLPAGLGVTEGGLVALAVLFGGADSNTAVLAALLSRAAILGVVIGAGLVALWLLRRRPQPTTLEGPEADRVTRPRTSQAADGPR